MQGRLSEWQRRLAGCEAEVAGGGRREAELRRHSEALAAQQHQQRLQFDRCLDDIANHVVQALVSQKVTGPNDLFNDSLIFESLIFVCMKMK